MNAIRRTGPRRATGTVVVALLVAFAVVVPGVLLGVASATPVSGCQTIDSSGTYELQSSLDIDDAYQCIVITASGVTFDGNGHTINGTEVPNPSFGNKIGIQIDETATNVDVQDVRLVGWGRGIQTSGDDASITGVTGDDSIFVFGNGTTVADVSLDGASSILLSGNGNHLRDSSSRNATTGVSIDGDDNTVSGSIFTDVSNTGIRIYGGMNATIVDTRVERGYHSTGGGGIDVDGGSDHTIETTTVVDTVNGMGVRINAPNTTIVDSTISNSSTTGLWIVSADGSVVDNTTVLDSGQNRDRSGIRVSHSDDSVVRDNYVRGSPEDAITVESATNVTVAGNDVGDVSFYGIGLAERLSNGPVVDSVVRDNVVTDVRYQAIHLSDATGITIRNNTITNPTDRPNMDGISLTSSSNHSVVVENTIGDVQIGIRVQSNDNHTVTRNRVTSSASYGLYVSQAEDTLVYDNYLENDVNIYTWSGSDNAFNVSKTAGTNVVGGPYLGGNFYANSSGDGYSQTCGDVDADGLCDSELVHDGGYVDYLPLAEHESTSTPTPTPSPTPIVSPTPTPSPTPTATASPTPAPTASPTPTQSPTPSPTPTATSTSSGGGGGGPPPGTPAIVITDASLSSGQIAPGESVTVRVELENPGTGDGTLSMSLDLDGTQVASKSAFVAAGGTQVIHFTYTFPSAGTYDLAVDGVAAGTLVVADSTGTSGPGTATTTSGSSDGTATSAPTPTATPDGGAVAPSDSGTTEGTGPGFGVVALVVGVLGIALLAIRRQP